VVDRAGDLHVAVALGKMGGADEAGREQAGLGGKGRVLGAEGDGEALVLGNVAAGKRGHHHAPVGGGSDLDDLAGIAVGGDGGGKDQSGESGDVEEHCFC